MMKLPRFEKKVLVALDWTLDVLFSKDLVHFRTTRPLTPPPVEEESEREPVQFDGASLVPVRKVNER